MDGNNVKKNDENGQLSCGIYSCPAAAGLLLQSWVGDHCRDRSIYIMAYMDSRGYINYYVLAKQPPLVVFPSPSGGAPTLAAFLHNMKIFGGLRRPKWS